MDEYSDYNPQYCIEGVTFRLYNSEEIKALSVKEIKNLDTFDNLQQPTSGGLYDPALGPTDRDDACATCGQNQLHCPGHMGHIELPLVVFNPVFFKTMYQILQSSCYECHRMNCPPLLVHLFVNQCRLLDHGKISSVAELEDIYSQTVHADIDKGLISQHCRETVTEFTDKAIKDAIDVDILVKNVEAIRHRLVKEFIRDRLKRTGKCLLCTARIRPIRKERQGKVVLIGKLKEEVYETPRKFFSGEKDGFSELHDNSEGEADEGFDESSEEGEPKAKRQKLANTSTKPSDSASKKHDVTLLTPLMIRDHLRKVWKQDAVLLKRLYSSLATSPAENPADIFFLDIIPVPPARFRPISVMKGFKYENAQTANLNKVMKSGAVVRELLWEIEKAAAKTSSDQVSSDVLSLVPGRTLADKLDNAWVRLQTHVNCVLDSNLDKLSKDVNPGIKQLLEKKEGLFRKNMMGKRVNYAARSVISPDPNINTSEIGIPEVFATALTYPQPVTPWNVQELRQMVINGPKKHPGACFVVNEDGSKVFLDSKKKIQREAIAKQLLKPSTSHSKITTGVKKVYRHLKNGDVLLINRQPTLHRPSIQAHKARVLSNEKTLRLHYANCKAYNADFDGDEMNAHFPQNEIARAEAYNIASTDFQYLVPKDGTPLAGLIQDHMVSGVSLTIRGRYFSKQDYCKLVYGALVDKNGPVKLLPPTILKPFRLWSGKQVLSTVLLNVIPDSRAPLSLTGRAKVPEKAWIQVHKHRGSSLMATPAYLGESDVIIRQGELLCGVLDKGHYGPTPFGLVHSCYELYGGNVAGKLLTCFGRLFMNFLQLRGFTLGVEDILVTGSADKKRSKIIQKSLHCGSRAVKKALDLDDLVDDNTLEKSLKSAHFNTDDRQMREIDMAMRNQTNQIQNEIVNVTMPLGLEKLFPDNNLQLMVVSGAKGSSVNCMQISCLLGQIELEGKRPPLMLSGKTLPSFLPYDVTPRAGGFVTGRFLTGIRQQEYFFHCMAGREGLIDTAVKTSRSGYLQRCLIKHLEGVKVNYDLTVRDSDSSVIQFYYGEDGLDITKTGYLTPKQFPFLLENHHILHTEEDQERKEKRKIKKLLKQIKKWHKKNKSMSGQKQRSSGFLKFCQSAILDVSMETDEGSWEKSSPGRAKEEIQKCRAWRHLSEEQRKIYSKYTGSCPEPVITQVSPYLTGAISERLETIINEYTAHSLHVQCPSMLGSQFHDLLSNKVKHSLVEPGEAVGLLCAQSIGEPSTQMTLNTFHFAGRGEMNVTLGIPRLREILMVGSAEIKTPAMDVPVKPGIEAKHNARKLQKKFNKVCLNEVIKDVKVAEYLAIKGRSKIQRRRMFRVTFTFLPKACYKERFVLTPSQILEFMEDVYIKKLVIAIRKKINASAKSQVLSSGTAKSTRPSQRVDRQEEENEEAVREEDEDEDEEEVEGDDGDAAAVKEKNKKQEEQEYENDENDEDDNGEATEDEVEMDDIEMNGNLDDVGMEIDETEEGKAVSGDARIHAVLQISSEVENYSYDDRKHLWCEVTLSFPLSDSKIDLLALVEKDIKRVVVHEVSGISRCFLGDENGPQGTEFHLKTEGINMHELYKYQEVLDLNRLYSNSIHVMANTYGIEAACKVIIKEIQSVFAAYGIEVDYRHLSLLADYMTFEGTYKPFNRKAMESNPSPLQKMSFETTMHFLVNSSINAGMDNLSSPSAQIVLGKVVSCGTGSHDLMNPLIAM